MGEQHNELLLPKSARKFLRLGQEESKEGLVKSVGLHILNMSETRTGTCFTQSCEQIITGRNLYYDRIIEILQNEEYINEANLEDFANENYDQLLLPRQGIRHTQQNEPHQNAQKVPQKAPPKVQIVHKKKPLTKVKPTQVVTPQIQSKNSQPQTIWSPQWAQQSWSANAGQGWDHHGGVGQNQFSQNFINQQDFWSNNRKSSYWKRRKRRSVFRIIENTINRLTYDPNNLAEEIESPRPGLFWASILLFLIVPFSMISPLQKILPGQAPPGSPQPGIDRTGGASPNALGEIVLALNFEFIFNLFKKFRQIDNKLSSCITQPSVEIACRNSLPLFSQKFRESNGFGFTTELRK